MTRLMFDSTSPWDIPRDAEMVAYYVDGLYAWPQSWLDMFPNAVKVGISAIGRNTAVVGDVEVGCIWPPRNAVPWVQRARRDGYDPTIYVNELNDWGPTRQAFHDAGEPEPHWWTARYNGVRQIPAGAIGRQFAHPHDGDGVANNPWETGKHYDLSVIADHWPGVDEDMTPEEVYTQCYNALAQVSKDAADGTASDIAEAWRNVIVHYVLPKQPEGTGQTSPHRQTQLADEYHRQVLRAIADSATKPAPVNMTEADRAAIAAQVRSGLLDDLAPLFDLARRLES